MKISKKTFTLTFTEPLLGSASGNREIHEEFIAAKATTTEAAIEEVQAIPETVAEKITKAMTVFPRDEKGLHLWDYQIRGMLKENVHSLIELGSVKGLSKWAYKAAVDKFVVVNPRRIYLLKEDGTIWDKAPDTLQRPLRATTMQGDRVALASSEMLPVGTSLSFEVITREASEDAKKKAKVAVLTMEDIEAAIDLCSTTGFGQWRSGGWGRFTWK